MYSLRCRLFFKVVAVQVKWNSIASFGRYRNVFGRGPCILYHRNWKAIFSRVLFIPCNV